MSLESFITAMPKVELHVHLEGSTQPDTLLKLARRNGVSLPANTVEGLRKWFQFRDFPHFIDIYMTVCACIQTADDIELLAREFLAGQHAQHILHTEFTYTPYTHYEQMRLPFSEQLAALNRARAWAAAEFGISSGIITDINRAVSADEGVVTAEWAINGMGDGVIALGLGGPEAGHPPEKHAPSFGRARAAGLTCILHAGETAGASSIRGALNTAHSARIGHGVRCLEDPELVAYLRERQIPLEVCPSSNICLGVSRSLADHPLPHLMAEGLYVTVNSDDPPMFDTTLTNELQQCARRFDWDVETLEWLTQNAAAAALLPPDAKQRLQARIAQACAAARAVHLAN